MTRRIKPAIGRHALAKLEPVHVQQMLDGLPERLSPTTRRYTYTVLRIALGRAVKQQLVVRNVATLIDPPTKARIEIHPLTAEQARAFLGSVEDDRLSALYVMALSTGMRQGELLALRWFDVDLDTRMVTVTHTLQQRTHALGQPKTANGRRTLRLGELAVVALRRHKAAQNEARLAAGRRWLDGSFIFTTATGRPLDARNVTRWFQAALERAGLPRQRFHDMRHASATMGLEAEESMYEVSRRLGHSTLATTADIYGHITPAMQERSAARLDRALGG